MNILRDNWCDIDALCVSDATLHDNHSQIESGLRNVMMQWINEGNEGNESALIEALKVTKETFSGKKYF